MSKVARKKSKKREVVKCGAVEAPHIDRGWVCCACFKKQGAGTYNGATRKQCKQCGHDRCAGAMRRKWTGFAEVEASEIKVARLGSEPAGLLSTFMSVLSFMQQMRNAVHQTRQAPTAIDPAKEDAKWQTACDDVVAAFSAARLHAEQSGRKMPDEPIPVDVLAEKVRANLPRALQIYQMGDHGPSCHCRHLCLVVARAEQLAKETGEPYDKLAKSGMHVVEWYLSQRS